MRVFVAGGTGAIGRHLVPALVAAGHEVTATTRSPDKTAQLRAAGATPVVLDGLDRAAVLTAVRDAAPEVVVHQMTALQHLASLRNVDRTFAATNELRTRGTDHLIAAARAAGVRRLIAQGNAGLYEQTGARVKTETDALLERAPSPAAARTLAAIRHLDRTVRESAPEGIVLRYGNFYGPGASEPFVTGVRKRQIPVIGGGAGVWSFIHTADAATATVAAVEHGTPGAYNVVDDDPAPAAAWLPYLAEVAGARPPLHLPAWLARPLAGGFVVAQMTVMRGAANDKAKKDLGWAPRHASWREGFHDWVRG